MLISNLKNHFIKKKLTEFFQRTGFGNNSFHSILFNNFFELEISIKFWIFRYPRSHIWIKNVTSTLTITLWIWKFLFRIQNSCETAPVSLCLLFQAKAFFAKMANPIVQRVNRLNTNSLFLQTSFKDSLLLPVISLFPFPFYSSCNQDNLRPLFIIREL